MYIRSFIHAFAILLLISLQLAAQQEPKTNPFNSSEVSAVSALRVEQYLKTLPGPRNPGVVTLTPVTGPDGKFTLLSPEGDPLPVKNGSILEYAPKSVPLPVTISVENGKVTILKWALPSTAGWNEEKRKLPVSKFGELHEAFADLDETLKKAQIPGSMSGDSAQVDEKIAKAEEVTINAYTSNQTTSDEKENLGRRYGELQRAKPKAVYRTPDLYRPIHYQQIYQSTRSSAALYSIREEKVIGSGVLIGRDLVLTCEHNISEDRLDNFNPEEDVLIRFDYEEGIDKPQEPIDYNVAKVLFRGVPSSKSKVALDFALLQLKPKTVDGKPQSASDRFPSAKLATIKKLPTHKDPVYVVGHPNGTFRTVHDNAFVLFPFQVEKRTFDKLEMEVRKEFDRLVYEVEGEKKNGWQVAANQLRSERDESLKEFAGAYIPLGDGRTQRQLYHPRAEHLPTIAADCDTSEGNSGSGVWGRRNHLLIGILFYGSTEQHVSFDSGWRRHEMILPITEIVQQLDADPELGPSWRAKHGVEFE